MHKEKYLTKGLSAAEVSERRRNGLSNDAPVKSGKSIKEIIAANTLTYFNFIFAVITVLLCIVGSFRNLTFLPIVIGNTLVGIFQEIRAKRVLDKMSLLNAPHAIALRDGVRLKLPSSSLVCGDAVIFSAGNQICADARVVEGTVSVNEALLTGESDEIPKCPGDKLLSGSFVVSGECCAVLENVGSSSYISKLTAEAKNTSGKEQSEMIRSINRIVKWMGFILIPIGSILFYQSFFVTHEALSDSIVSMVAAVIGMIPEGLYLLTTAALALGTIRLSKRRVLLNDMKSIEALARVDVLCVDKTGTITEPTMTVYGISAAEGSGLNEEALNEAVSKYIYASPDNNATMEALRRHFKRQLPETPSEVVPFSSSVKYGAVTLKNGTWVLGAPEFILGKTFEQHKKQLEKYIKKGYRLLAFARQDTPISSSGISDTLRPMGFIILSNAIRAGAERTFGYFREQGVEIKVISGDHPETVSETARLAGIEHTENFIDASSLDTDEKIRWAASKFTIFGRVTPKQKQKLVLALKAQGHTVAMTGDGVNDILAMKDSDCGIAMASGSEAVSQAAQVVLMDSNFSAMPRVVYEGRRVVNNIQRSASLFLVKNIFSLLLSIMASVLMLTYPLEPSHISLISMFTIGFPGFLLALEGNKNRIDGSFLRNVLLKALPAGLTDAIIVGSLAVFGNIFSLPRDDIATASTLILAVVGFMILHRISTPFNKYRRNVFWLNIAGIMLSFIFIPHLFSISLIPATSVLLTLIFSLAAESLFRILSIFVERCEIRMKKRAAAVKHRRKNKHKRRG